MNKISRAVSSCVCGRLLHLKNVNYTRGRNLYTESYLGVDRYAEQRNSFSRQIGNVKENFFSRMKEQLSVPSAMVFTEDLKSIIHLCEDSEEQVEICIQMLKRFHKQNKELRFGTFVFGPVALRLFYHFKKPDLVLQLLNDEELNGFFDQLKSYTLSMDLLYKSGMYEEVIKLNEQVQCKQLVESKFPRESVLLVTASCYKLNTPETYKYATELLTRAREARASILRKTLTFVAGLSLKQNRPDVALEILSSIEHNNNATGNNLKLITLGELGRLQDTFSMLRHVVDKDYPTQAAIKGEICQCTIDSIQKAVDRSNDVETSHIFEQLCRSLKENNSITNQTVDELLCSPMELKLPVREGRPFARQKNYYSERSYIDRSSPPGMSNPVRHRSFASMDD